MNPTSRCKKTPGAGTPRALGNVTTGEEMNVMTNHSTAVSEVFSHKTKAVAALRADAPLAARLARYNAAMAKARSLEAQEATQ